MHVPAIVCTTLCPIALSNLFVIPGRDPGRLRRDPPGPDPAPWSPTARRPGEGRVELGCIMRSTRTRLSRLRGVAQGARDAYRPASARPGPSRSAVAPRSMRHTALVSSPTSALNLGTRPPEPRTGPPPTLVPFAPSRRMGPPGSIRLDWAPAVAARSGSGIHALPFKGHCFRSLLFSICFLLPHSLRSVSLFIDISSIGCFFQGGVRGVRW